MLAVTAKKEFIDMQKQNRYIHEFIHLIASNLHHVPSRVMLARRRKKAARKSICKVCARDSYQHTLNSWSTTLFDLCLVNLCSR